MFQRENIEMYLKACANYGLKEQDLFQVNDLYENKNLYMVVDNLYSLGGMVSFLGDKNLKKHPLNYRYFSGPKEVLGGSSSGCEGGEWE